MKKCPRCGTWIKRVSGNYSKLDGNFLRGSPIMITSGKNEGMCRIITESRDGIITVESPLPYEIELGTTFTVLNPNDEVKEEVIRLAAPTKEQKEYMDAKLLVLRYERDHPWMVRPLHHKKKIKR